MDTVTKKAYRAIAFQLKKNPLTSNIVVKKLLGYRDVVISEHPENEDEDCEWNMLHYHGVVEHFENYRFDSDRIFNQVKDHCVWFKSEQCKLPVNFCAYMQIPPRKIVYTNERSTDSDLTMLLAQVTPELIEEVKARKTARKEAKQESGRDIMYLKNLILKSNAQSEAELLEYYHNDNNFENVYCKRTFSQNFKKALSFAIQETLHIPIRDLCCNFEDKKNQCMPAVKSANLMEKWCHFQGIDPGQFARDFEAVLDRTPRKQNCICLTGEPNSGKTFIAKSMEKACIFYAEIVQGTAGYAFMWQDCINKRVIVINEPCFDYTIIETLKAVLEGTGTYVHKKNSSDEYLRPTPVLITSNVPVWNMCSGAEQAIRVRCKRIYDNLKPCPFLKYVRKDLHPGWLTLLLIRHAKEAAPVSDISDDDECRTSPAIDSADLEPTPAKRLKTEARRMSLTPTVHNTTSTSKTPQSPKRRPIADLLNAPKRKASSEIPLRELSKQNPQFKTSLSSVTCCLAKKLDNVQETEENSCQSEDTSVNFTSPKRSPRIKNKTQESTLSKSQQRHYLEEHQWIQDPKYQPNLPEMSEESAEEEDKSPT